MLVDLYQLAVPVKIREDICVGPTRIVFALLCGNCTIESGRNGNQRSKFSFYFEGPDD
jgi:hypothetical protein